MIIGEKQRIAAQLELDLPPAGSLLFGRFCFWIGGQMVGRFENGCILTDLWGQLTYPVGYCGQRRSPRFCNMRAADLYRILNIGIHGYGEAPEIVDNVEQTAIEEMWARFNISVKIETLDDWSLYLIDCDEFSRLLVGKSSEGEIGTDFRFEQTLELGEYDKVARQLQYELDLMHDTYVDKPRNCDLL